MKYLFYLLFIFLSCNQNYSQNTKIMKKSVYIGMSQSEFLEIYSNLDKTNTTPDKQWTIKETIYSLNGEWTYSFKNNKLDWYVWDYYDEDITEEKFNKCLNTTKKIFDKNSQLLGKPTKSEDFEMNYKDPYKQRHWGYEVCAALWKTEKEQLKVSFEFLGGKGMYQYLIKIECQKADYEYLDW